MTIECECQSEQLAEQTTPDQNERTGNTPALVLTGGWHSPSACCAAAAGVARSAAKARRTAAVPAPGGRRHIATQC